MKKKRKSPYSNLADYTSAMVVYGKEDGTLTMDFECLAPDEDAASSVLFYSTVAAVIEAKETLAETMGMSESEFWALLKKEVASDKKYQEEEAKRAAEQQKSSSGCAVIPFVPRKRK